MMNKQEEKLMTVQIEQEYDIVKQDWEDRVFIKLYVAMRTSGLLKALGDKHFRSLVALALYMNKDGKCSPSLEELAKTLGVSKTSASNRYQELCAFQWKGKPIVTRKEIRDPHTKERKGTEYTILVDSIRIFDNKNPEDTPSSSFLEPGQTPQDTPSSSFLEPGQNSQRSPETPQDMPSSRKPKLGQPNLGQDERNYIIENNTDINTVKNEYSTEYKKGENKNIQITMDDLKDLELDSSFLPDNFPPKFARAVKRVRDDFQTINYYFNIARMGHKDAEKAIKEQDPDFAFGEIYFDDDIAASSFLATIGQAKLGKIKESIEAHFRGTVKRKLIKKHFEERNQKIDFTDFKPINWLELEHR